jgi:hypothetical protein
MRFTKKAVSVPPPGERNSKGTGWSKVFVHLHDTTLNVMPSITIEAAVPYEPGTTYQEAREATLILSREMLRSALAILDGTSLDDIDG